MGKVTFKGKRVRFEACGISNRGIAIWQDPRDKVWLICIGKDRHEGYGILMEKRVAFGNVPKEIGEKYKGQYGVWVRESMMEVIGDKK